MNLTDVRNRRLKEEVDVILRHRTLAETRKARVKPGAAATITDLRVRPEGVYHVFIDPPIIAKSAQTVFANYEHCSE